LALVHALLKPFWQARTFFALGGTPLDCPLAIAPVMHCTFFPAALVTPESHFDPAADAPLPQSNHTILTTNVAVLTIFPFSFVN
jgi:hypothetical protein